VISRLNEQRELLLEAKQIIETLHEAPASLRYGWLDKAKQL
jgi:hypothetical protein